MQSGLSGAVPVYLGAPNVNDFVPANSIINVPYPFNQTAVVEVAREIKLIFNSKKEYEKKIWYKIAQKYDDGFVQRFDFTRQNPYCTICRKVSEIKCSRSFPNHTL